MMLFYTIDMILMGVLIMFSLALLFLQMDLSETGKNRKLKLANLLIDFVTMLVSVKFVIQYFKFELFPAVLCLFILGSVIFACQLIFFLLGWFFGEKRELRIKQNVILENNQEERLLETN